MTQEDFDQIPKDDLLKFMSCSPRVDDIWQVVMDYLGDEAKAFAESESRERSIAFGDFLLKRFQPTGIGSEVKWGTPPMTFEFFTTAEAYDRFIGESKTEPLKLYKALYNENIWEGGPVTISLHRTKEGAEKAIAEHREKEERKYREMCERAGEESLNDADDFPSSYQKWGVDEIEVKP